MEVMQNGKTVEALPAPRNINTAEINAQIKASLDSFSQLLGNYALGEKFVEENGGIYIDKALQMPRSSLLHAIHGKKSIPFGPLTNSKAIVQVPSEGEESEIDITDLVPSSQP